MKNNSGFTLVELMITVAVMMVLILGGTLIMYRSLSSRSINQASSNITSLSTQTLDVVESFVKYAKVDMVQTDSGNFDRDACEAGGVAGVTGTGLVVSDLYGTTTIGLVADRIASDSGTRQVNLSASGLKIKELAFTWTCISGGNDRLRVHILATDASGNFSGSAWDKTFDKEVNMYNSRK